jgi:hypothetical protein
MRPCCGSITPALVAVCSAEASQQRQLGPEDSQHSKLHCARVPASGGELFAGIVHELEAGHADDASRSVSWRRPGLHHRSLLHNHSSEEGPTLMLPCCLSISFSSFQWRVCTCTVNKKVVIDETRRKMLGMSALSDLPGRLASQAPAQTWAAAGCLAAGHTAAPAPAPAEHPTCIALHRLSSAAAVCVMQFHQGADC